jgi:site-specific DNA-cytosine methylase
MIRVIDLFAGAGGESTGIVQALDGERSQYQSIGG